VPPRPVPGRARSPTATARRGIERVLLVVAPPGRLRLTRAARDDAIGMSGPPGRASCAVGVDARGDGDGGGTARSRFRTTRWSGHSLPKRTRRLFSPRPYGLQVYLQRDDEAVDLHVLSLIFRRPLPPAPARRLLHLFLLAASDSSASAFDGGPIRPGGGGGWWPARRGESGHWRGGWPRVRADWP
jgi:hypothetical protein